jgi:hypothetical protein
VEQSIVESGVLSARTGATSLLETELESNRREEHVDFRPHLPLVCTQAAKPLIEIQQLSAAGKI